MPAPTLEARYPWYDLVSEADLQQGDILLACPFFQLPPVSPEATSPVQVTVQLQNAIVMTQSCDLALREGGRCDAEHVALCPVYRREELANDDLYGKPANWEKTRKGQVIAYHLLNKCEIQDHAFDFTIVDLGGLFSLPIALVRDLAARQNPRVRLNPPYREQLAQAFARFFMRVGLPVDIPSFR